MVNPLPPTAVATGNERVEAVVEPVTHPREVQLPQEPDNSCMTGVAALRLADIALMLMVGKALVATNLNQTSAEFALPHPPGTPEVGAVFFRLDPVELQEVPGVSVTAPEQSSWASPFLFSNRSVLMTRKTFTDRVSVKEVFIGWTD